MRWQRIRPVRADRVKVGQILTLIWKISQSSSAGFNMGCKRLKTGDTSDINGHREG